MTATPLRNDPPAKGATLLDVFPRRRIIIHFAGTLAQGWSTVGILFGLSLLPVFMLCYALPDIARDWAMSREGKSVIEETARIDGQCKRMKLIVVDCEARITYRPDPDLPREITVEQDFMFIGTDYNTTVDVLRSTVHPERVTTSIAIDHLGNRIATLLGLVLLLGGIVVAGAIDAWHSYQRRRLEGKAMVLQPHVVSITSIDEHNNVKFTASVNGREVKSHHRMRVGDAPLFIRNSGMALAVAVPDTAYLILIDQDMTALAFTDLERAQLRAAAA